jgi:hypothetical protein
VKSWNLIVVLKVPLAPAAFIKAFTPSLIPVGRLYSCLHTTWAPAVVSRDIPRIRWRAPLSALGESDVKLRLGIALNALLLATQGVYAADEVGLGTNTCGTFASQYRDNAMDADYQFGQWAAGYLTGANLVLQASGRPRKELPSFAKIRGLMRAYCNDHPLSGYEAGVIELLRGLPDEK